MQQLYKKDTKHAVVATHLNTFVCLYLSSPNHTVHKTLI